MTRDGVDQALRRNVSSASNSKIGNGNKVSMFRRSVMENWWSHISLRRERTSLRFFNTDDRLLPASIEKIEPYRETGSSEHNAVENALDVILKNLDRDSDRLDDFVIETSKDIPRQEVQAPLPITMSQLEDIFGRNGS